MAVDISLVLPVFREKVETAVAMVPSMPAKDKLQAVQLWNILSEKLQEIVNSSAADINALAYQESIPSSSYYYVPPVAEGPVNQGSSTSVTAKDRPPDVSQDNSKSSLTANPAGYEEAVAELPGFLQVPAECEESLPALSINGISTINENIEADDSIGNSFASFSDIQCSDDGDMDGVCLLAAPPLDTTEKADDPTKGQDVSTLPADVPVSDVESATDKKRFRCTVCQATFRSNTHLLAHGRRHTGERPFRCTECGNSFTTMSNLKRHTRSHGGEKQWACEECDARFLEKKTLLVHMRTHTGEKPYACDICDKRFTQLCVLQSHMALHDNSRSHLCELCGKSFRQKSQMKTHMLRHKGVRRVSCDLCSMAFLTKSDHSRHMRVHTGERPFSCNLCSKNFTRLQSLNEHRNRHYGLKPYECKTCLKGFAELSAYRKHEKRHEHLANQNSEQPSSE